MIFCKISNITKKIFIVLLLLTIGTTLITTEVKAVDEMVTAGKIFLGKGEDPTSKISEESLNNASSTIFKILMVIAIGVAVVVAAILGFNFITGSVEGKAKIMESLMPYIAGCIVAFGAFGIWSTVVKTGDSIEDEIAWKESAMEKIEDEGILEDEAFRKEIVASVTEMLEELYLAGDLEGLYRIEGIEVVVAKSVAVEIMQKEIYGIDAESEGDKFAVLFTETYIEAVKRMPATEFRFLAKEEYIVSHQTEALGKINKEISEMLHTDEGTQALKNAAILIGGETPQTHTITLGMFRMAVDSLRLFRDEKKYDDYSTICTYLISKDPTLVDYKFAGKTVIVTETDISG